MGIPRVVPCGQELPLDEVSGMTFRPVRDFAAGFASAMAFIIHIPKAYEPAECFIKLSA